ncbi:MAG: trigger factor [FCB group bacterium]|nr:trigger factor [FCB group bacterium]
MKTDSKEINSYTRELSITVPWEELKDDFEKSVRQFNKRVKIPGFRPGKAPRKVVLAQYLPNIEANFVEDAFHKAYIKALDELDLSPVNQATIKALDFHYESDLTFTAQFEVEPDITLPALKKNSLKVTRTRYQSDEEDVQSAIEEIRYARAEVHPVEDGSKEGHFILGDLQELDASGVPVIGRKLEKRYLKVGDGIFKGDNLKKLEGLKPGDISRVEIPDEAGNPIPFELTVIRVEEQVLPDVDDDFVKQVDPRYDSVDAWRASVKERIDKNYEQRAIEQYERALSDALIEKINPEYAPSMVDAYLDHLIEDAKKTNNGEPLDESKIREAYRSTAERNLKWYLIRSAIIEQEGLEVTRDEVQTKVKEIVEASPAEQRKQIEKYYKKPSNRHRIEDDLMEEKVLILKYVEQFTKVKEVIVKTDDLRKMSQEEHDHEH